MKFFKNIVFPTLLIFLIACNGGEPPPPPPPVTPPAKTVTVKIPTFDGNRAYDNIQKQVDFGHRVPNTPGHKACKEWLVSEFDNMGLRVIEQDFTAQAYTGEVYNATNIIASLNPDAANRVLLCAHWDTRHIADADANADMRDKPILGADDGGSGVGVLLEVGRLIAQDSALNIGVDIVLFDAEDNGASRGASESWCLGSQYWGKKTHVPNYKARFGILLDMVGEKSPRFMMEQTSMTYAPNLMMKVWNLAHSMGYSGYFDKTQAQGVTDDHLFVNKLTGIPTIDIINLEGSQRSMFGPHWHTHNDNMDIIGKNTLTAVGNVVLKVLYMENARQFTF